MPLFDSDSEALVTFEETDIIGSASNKAAMLIAGVTPTNTASFLTVFDDGSVKVSGSFSLSTDVPIRSIVVNEQNNPIGFVSDSSGLRLKVVSSFVSGTTVNIYGAGTTNAGFIVRKNFHNTGAINLNVDGSINPVEFIFQPELGQSVKVNYIKFCLICNRIVTNGMMFGSIPSIDNGIEMSIVQSSTKTVIANLRKTEDLLLLPGPNPEINRTGTNDILLSTYFIGGSIVLSEQDFISLVVRDDLSNTSIKFLEAFFYGVIE